MAIRLKAFIIELIDSWELLAAESLVTDNPDKQSETMIPPFV